MIETLIMINLLLSITPKPQNPKTPIDDSKNIICFVNKILMVDISIDPMQQVRMHIERALLKDFQFKKLENDISEVKKLLKYADQLYLDLCKRWL